MGNIKLGWNDEAFSKYFNADKPLAIIPTSGISSDFTPRAAEQTGEIVIEITWDELSDSDIDQLIEKLQAVKQSRMSADNA